MRNYNFDDEGSLSPVDEKKYLWNGGNTQPASSARDNAKRYGDA